MSKPSIAELLSASGYSSYTGELIGRAVDTLYADIGAGLDSRDWDAIMAADNPLEASETALVDMYQDAQYLEDNADHLQNKGYTGAMIEWTNRQIYERLDIESYDPSWADGTWMETYAQMSDSEVYNQAQADAEPPPPPPVSITTNVAPFDTTDGTGMVSSYSADSGTDNTIEIAAAGHLNGSSVVDGVGGTNTISLTENATYSLTTADYGTLQNVSNLEWSNNIAVTIDNATLAEFSAITGAGGAGDQLILEEDANFDFSTTALTGVETIVTANATAGKTYTFDAADLNDVTAVTGQSGAGQILTLNDSDDLSDITFTDMETLTFGNFTVNIDTGNLASFDTITGGGTGTLDLNEDVNYDFSTTALTGVSTITTTGVTATKTYTFDAADLNDVTTITGTDGEDQKIILNDDDDWTTIETTKITTISLADGASITNSYRDSIKSVTAIEGTDGVGENFTITAHTSSGNDIIMYNVTQTNIDTLTINGNVNDNDLTGTAGDDVINGFDGPDKITPGDGSNTIDLGDDAYTDTVVYYSLSATDTILNFKTADDKFLFQDQNAESPWLNLNGTRTKDFAKGDITTNNSIAGNVIVATAGLAGATDGTGVDTQLAAQTGAVAGGAIAVVYNTDSSQAEVWFDAAAGTANGAGDMTLLGVIDGYGAADVGALDTGNFDVG